MRKAAILLLPLLSVLLVSQTFVVLAQEPPPAKKFYGVWYVYPAGNPAADAVRREFRHNNTTGKDEMVVTHACPGDNKAVTAKAVSPIEVSEETIHVLRSASDSQRAQNNTACEVKIDPGVLSYTFSEDGTHVTITNPGGNPDILELAREETRTEPVLPQNLYGTWLLPPINTKEFTVQTRLVFYADGDRHERVRQIAVCSKGNDSVVSHVDTDINVVNDRITVVESAAHEEPLGTIMCKTSLAAGTWRYALAPGGVTMTLFMDGGKTAKLTRERQPGLNYY